MICLQIEIVTYFYDKHNLFTGWIDTTEDNYPPPLSSHLAFLIMSFGEYLLQKEMGLGKTCKKNVEITFFF